jgi:hypothetical protein
LAEALLRKGRPRVIAARYDVRSRRIVVDFASRLTVSFPIAAVEELDGARAVDLRDPKIGSSGLTVYFPAKDEELDIPRLLSGMFGSNMWMASRLGSAGGRSKSKAKKMAARANGKLGGRPKKNRG